MIHARPIASGPSLQKLTWLQEVDGGLAFASLRSDWGQLLARSTAGPFLSWEWLYPWWRRVAPEREPRVLVLRDAAGAAVSLLPLCESRERHGGVPVRRWGFLGDQLVGSDYLDLLAPEGAERAMADTMIEHLVPRLDRMDVLELNDLPKGSVFIERLLEKLTGHALIAQRFPRYLCPLIEITGEYEAYLTKAGRADNLARRRKWLVAQPGFAIERLETPQAVDGALADFFKLHALRWEKDGGSQGIQTPQVRSFHRDSTALLSELGWLRLYMLKLKKQPLASVYGIIHRNRFYYYQSGYDPEWARRSVGLVLLGETLSDAFREGRTVFEWLRGTERYKSEWASGARETEAVRFIFPTAGGLAYLATLEGTTRAKSAIKSLAGDRVWKAARHWLKRRP